MSQETSAIWYLENAGAKRGPFTPEQIQEQLHSGSIRSSDKVTAAHMAGRWVDVDKLMKTYFRNEFTTSLSLPQRPQVDLTTHINLKPKSATSDPATGLLEVLQVARERQQKVFIPPHQQEEEPGLLKRIPRRVWLTLSLLMVLAVFAWGLSSLLRSKEPDGALDKKPVVKSAPVIDSRPAPVVRPQLPGIQIKTAGQEASVPLGNAAPRFMGATPSAPKALPRGGIQPRDTVPAKELDRDRDREDDRREDLPTIPPTRSWLGGERTESDNLGPNAYGQDPNQQPGMQGATPAIQMQAPIDPNAPYQDPYQHQQQGQDPNQQQARPYP